MMSLCKELVGTAWHLSLFGHKKRAHVFNPALLDHQIQILH